MSRYSVNISHMNVQENEAKKALLLIGRLKPKDGEISVELARRSSSRGISRKFYGSEVFQIFSSNIQFLLPYPHNSS